MQQEAFACLCGAGYHTVFAGHEDRVYSREVLESDLIVSLPYGLARLPRRSGRVKLLYTCNTHIAERVRRLRATASRWGLPIDEELNVGANLAAYRAADYFLIAENDSGVQNFLDRGVPERRIKRYHNCVDTDFWVPGAAKREPFTFVCWSSTFGLRKGLPALVQGWERWYRGQAAELLLLGMRSATSDRLFQGRTDGVVRPGLRLSLGGYRPQDPEVAALLASCHVAVFPTLDDAQPSALQEMVSCGLPVITTVASGFEFPPEFCTYVEPDDPQALATALETWYARRGDLPEFASRARAFMLQNHSWGTFRVRFTQILEEVAAETGLGRR